MTEYDSHSNYRHKGPEVYINEHEQILAGVLLVPGLGRDVEAFRDEFPEFERELAVARAVVTNVRVIDLEYQLAAIQDKAQYSVDETELVVEAVRALAQLNPYDRMRVRAELVNIRKLRIALATEDDWHS